MENFDQKIKQIEEQKGEKQENLKKLKGFIEDKEKVTNNDVEEFLGVSNATAERYIEELEKDGLLEQIGQIGQGVYYKINIEPDYLNNSPQIRGELLTTSIYYAGQTSVV